MKIEFIDGYMALTYTSMLDMRKKLEANQLKPDDKGNIKVPILIKDSRGMSK